MDLGHNCYLTVSKVGLIHYLALGSHYACDDMGVPPYYVLTILSSVLVPLNAHLQQTVGQMGDYRQLPYDASCQRVYEVSEPNHEIST